MDKSATWRGNRFWQNHDREGHTERLQALAHKTIFPSRLGVDAILIGHRGDIIPIPDLLDDELPMIMSQPGETASSEIKVDSCPALKLDIESLHSRGRSSSTSMSPIDMRIAELEASIGTERASRLSASPRILLNLRPPEPVRRISLLTTKSGISRLPREITRKIVGLIEFRRDIAALSCVSKSWRDETFPVLYSTLVLRGWDQIMSCLATVSSASYIANLVTDLTLDTGSWPASHNHNFYSIVRDALDKTRKLRRLVLALDSDITLGYDISTVLEQCRFRLHHFVYEGPDPLSCLETFLDMQTMIRTLQVPHRPIPVRSSFPLPPHTTQLWLPLSSHASGSRYDNLANLSHLSLKGEISPLALEQFRPSPVHYLAHDIAHWIATKIMLPDWFSSLIPDVFSNLRILRLIGYWVACETSDSAIALHPPSLVIILPESPEWVDPDPFHLGVPNNANPPPAAENEKPPLGIGSYLAVGEGDIDKSKAPILRVEPGFLDMLRSLPHLQALELGGFVVRDVGQLRTQVGYAPFWLSRRTQWEEDFINCITSRAAKNLITVSFLACDKPLYLSAFVNTPSSNRLSHQLWTSYLDKARAQAARDTENSGTTISSLMTQAGLQRWAGSASEPSACDYNVNSAFVPSKLARDLSEEVVMNDWINMGVVAGWKKRVNVRHLRDIWPQGF